MLREFTTFENNQDGGEVNILFDKTTMNRNNSNNAKKGITLKTILFILTACVFLLIFLNIITGFPSWLRHRSHNNNFDYPDGQKFELHNGYLKLFFIGKLA